MGLIIAFVFLLIVFALHRNYDANKYKHLWLKAERKKATK